MVSPAFAQEPVSVSSVTKPADPVQKQAHPVPKSVRRGLKAVPVQVRFPALDRDAVQAEDDRINRKGKPLRIGVFRPVAEAAQFAKNGAADAGIWSALPDGTRIWRLAVESPDAIGIRIHLMELSLPEECEITAYATDDPAQLRGPYDAESLGGRTEFWTGTVFADVVTLELVCPPGTNPDRVDLAVDRIIHIYRDPVSKIKVGSCHTPVACHTAWISTGNGVAGIGSVGDSGYLWCTGCLLNDQEPATFIDYFMTANHCVANQSEADDTEFYWFYQTPSCGGSPPAISTVPVTDGGATYLAGKTFTAANDFAFLRLRRATPGGVTYAGWSADTPSTSETLTGIHHPDGSYKRISFGKRTFSDANYWYVRWDNGVTEPGSSGSPLFNADQQFIGQLYGGYSSCSLPNGIDEYGRFNVSYPYIQEWLGSPTLAISPSSRTHSSAAAGNQTIAVSGGVSWTATDNRSWIAITSGSSGTGNGTVTYSLSANTGTTRTGTITVTGGGLTRTFTVTQLDGDAYEADNSASAARPIYNTQLQNRSIHRAGDVDWVKFVIRGVGAEKAVLETDGASGDTEMWLYKGATGDLLGYDDDSGNGDFSRITVASLSPGTHFLKIRESGNNGMIAAYTLRANWATVYPVDLSIDNLRVTRPGNITLRRFNSCKFHIVNRGAAINSATVGVHFHLSRDTTWGNDDDRKIGDTVFSGLSIPANSIKTITMGSTRRNSMVRLWTADLAPRGYYYLFARISPISDKETNWADNRTRTSSRFPYSNLGN